MITSISSENKISILVATLSEIFGKSFHLSRLKFIALFVSALCQVQSVGFEKLAIGFDTQVDTASSLRRIQRFIAHFLLDTHLIARLIFRLLPQQTSYRLVLDRTNWKFGQKHINILMLGVVYQGLAFPLLYEVLPKAGNSSSTTRIALIERYIKLFGKSSIDCILADREFIGQQWIEYLNGQALRYHIRIRENFWVYLPHSNKQVKATWLFADLKHNQAKHYPKIVRIKGQWVYLSASKIGNKEGKLELQIIISFNQAQQALCLYKERWQIETMFKALKSSGFNIEDTHLSDIERINKLLALVLIAFTWAYLVGIFLNNIQPIRILKNGRRAQSIFKYGLKYLAKVLYNNNLEEFKKCCHILSCT